MEDGRRDWQGAAVRGFLGHLGARTLKRDRQESTHPEARVQSCTAQADNGRGTTSQGGEAETAHARGRE